MPEKRSEMVEVFDVDRAGPAAPPAGVPDEISQGPRLDRWMWRRRHGVLNGALILLGLIGFVVAAAAGYGAVTAHPGTQFFVNERLVAAPVVAVDALGCPRTVTCVSRAVPATLLAVVTDAVPTGRITFALQTLDARSGRVYRREIDVSAGRATTPPVSMRLVSQCVPGSGPIAAQPPMLSVDTHPVAGAGTRPGGLNRVTEVLAGRRGCSLFAEADTTRWDYRLGDQSASEMIGQIARDPRLMVTP